MGRKNTSFADAVMLSVMDSVHGEERQKQQQQQNDAENSHGCQTEIKQQQLHKKVVFWACLWVLKDSSACFYFTWNYLNKDDFHNMQQYNVSFSTLYCTLRVLQCEENVSQQHSDFVQAGINSQTHRRSHLNSAVHRTMRWLTLLMCLSVCLCLRMFLKTMLHPSCNWSTLGSPVPREPPLRKKITQTKTTINLHETGFLLL